MDVSSYSIIFEQLHGLLLYIRIGDYMRKGGLVSEIKVVCKQSSMTLFVSLQPYYVE
jgi:hypothetical protein